ncbi:MAG: TrmH family RNA methyltransferase [Candidatus Pacebacteria bacterium]|nr:TrmH family RNA methyltransferase [Candidatus Paceibacterota bacterium]
MILILHNIRSLYNVGSIFRTADATGVEKIYLCGITPEPKDRLGNYREQMTKVSLGAEKSVKWEYVKSAARLIDKLKKEKYKILAVEQSKKSAPYYKRDVRCSKLEKLAVVLGNEVKGIQPAILKKADKILEIPMNGAMVRQAHHPKYEKEKGRKESLNVSVAAGIVLFRLKYPTG